MLFENWRRGLRRAASDRQGLGERGEDLAARELERRGYRILERRWRCRLGEIDVVALDGETLVFVEVKTRRRRSAAGPAPQDAVGHRKRRKLVRLADAYLAAKRRRGHHRDRNVRFDVVAVTVPARGPAALEVFRDAFGED